MSKTAYNNYRGRTETDITVTAVDLTSVAEKMTEEYRKGGDDRGDTTITVHGNTGFVVTPSGTLVLDTEGVFQGPLYDAETVRIYGYSHTPSENGASFSIVPVMLEILTVADLKELATDEVNLIEFVRTFGDRLDGNYERLRRTIEAGGVLYE